MFACWWSLCILCNKLHKGAFLENLVCSTSLMASLWSTRDLLEYCINVTQAVWDISPLMHMHQDPLLGSLDVAWVGAWRILKKIGGEDIIIIIIVIPIHSHIFLFLLLLIINFYDSCGLTDIRLFPCLYAPFVPLYRQVRLDFSLGRILPNGLWLARGAHASVSPSAADWTPRGETHIQSKA